MRFHFLLTNHYPFGLYLIEDHIRLISAGLAELGHDVTYGFDDDVPPWPTVNLLFEFFNDSPVVDQVATLKRSARRYAFGLILTEDLQDRSVMDTPDFPNRRAGLEKIAPHMEFIWSAVPCDLSALTVSANARFLQYGYAAALRRPDLIDRDIDVLFYGDLGPRRLPLFNSLRQRGVATSATIGKLPGYMKYDLLDRSRIVLDVARSDAVRFLAPSRLCTLLHTRSLVISEQIDKGPLSSLYRYTLPADFGQIVDIAVSAARNEKALQAGTLAREQFAQETSMARNLKAAMDVAVFREIAEA